MVRDIAIFGAGGYGREMASLLKRINKQQQCWNFIGFFDDDVVNKPIGYRNEYGEILGNLEMLNTYPKPLSVILAIGKPKILKAVYEAITNPLIDFPNIVAPEAHILDIDNFSMGKGNILGSFSSMSCNVHIGDFNIFNNRVSLGHDVFICIDYSSRKHELFARFIKNNTERNGALYTPVNEVQYFEEPEILVEKYNGVLYKKHQHLRIESYKEHFYIKEYEDHVRNIISNLLKHTESGIRNYVNSVESWMRTPEINIDSEEKKEAIKTLFKDSKVALIYGPAGTGKSMMINYISLFFKDKHKIFLANTNPAVENLRRKVTADNADFMTITKYLSASSSNLECDILCVDECSTVSNRDMVKVLEKSSFQLLLLVGDVYQIESILFGNWFSIAHFIMPKSAVVELTSTYRTTDHGLKEVWDKVRRITDDRLEFITKYGFSSALDDSIFSKSMDDEIVLCLNYDGLYGINNINKFLQSNNPNPSVRIGVQTYKVGDPVLFNESNRFAPLIYNNLKGKILAIEEKEDCVYFTIEIYMVVNELDVLGLDLVLLDSIAENTSVICFRVELQNDGDEDDDDLGSIVPFQIAYAVSIHKAQGLEYDSVKVVITNEIEEMVSHNIFYTAITRAKEKLKIYWSPETEKRVLENMKVQFNDKDYRLFKEKFKSELNLT